MAAEVARPSPVTRMLTFARGIAEIAVLGLYLVLAPQAFGWAVSRLGLEAEGITQVVGISVLYVPFFLLAVALVKLRGQNLADLGLRRPAKPLRAVIAGIAVAAFFFALVQVLKRTGVMSSDWSTAEQWAGNVPLLLAWLAMIVLLTGLIEEFIYRAFVMDRLASAFGGGRIAWASAVVLQAVIFALAHAYGDTELILFAGAFAFAYAALYFWTGRNLLAPIVAHIVYDAARIINFYVLATYFPAAIGG